MKMQSATAILLILAVVAATTTTTAMAISTSARPPGGEDALVARWLVNAATYGVLTTIDKKGFPFGNVVSHSDGGTGTPYFYLATELFRDPTGPYALKNYRASFTLCEADLGLCAHFDAQSPNCTKITLTGEVKFLNITSPGGAFGEALLFADHPAFARWPRSNGFGVFMLQIDRIFLVNGFKPAVDLPVHNYYSARKVD